MIRRAGGVDSGPGIRESDDGSAVAAGDGGGLAFRK